MSSCTNRITVCEKSFASSKEVAEVVAKAKNDHLQTVIQLLVNEGGCSTCSFLSDRISASEATRGNIM
jgi:tRNA(Phe) wybutosine-synthesizing methylase Tyw3